ncbi:hypothetical protein L6164_015454 [Bauhinia variegata]|uniref:Uncharacterized protein n=1 Tax=Bauhinia variegata TaxID=167791 RepID=A0ACB9NKN7_BAUVA|nr:hypothetical protein L6164_015454 [Bauhinia variegata]
MDGFGLCMKLVLKPSSPSRLLLVQGPWSLTVQNHNGCVSSPAIHPSRASSLPPHGLVSIDDRFPEAKSPSYFWGYMWVVRGYLMI